MSRPNSDQPTGSSSAMTPTTSNTSSVPKPRGQDVVTANQCDENTKLDAALASLNMDQDVRIGIRDDEVVELDPVVIGIIDGIGELTNRVEATLAKEERCWYELESPHVRNKRPEFILKCELDILGCVKNKEMKEMLEVLKEVGGHYADALDVLLRLREEKRILKQENAALKSNKQQVRLADRLRPLTKGHSLEVGVLEIDWEDN